jgi:hypothetical protein
VDVSLSVRDLTSKNGVVLATAVMIVKFAWAGLRPRCMIMPGILI